MSRKHWYSEPWVWLLIALPMCAVIGGVITLWLAVSTGDGLVVDDYYERGKEINLDLARDKAALREGVTASLSLSEDANAVDVQLDIRNGVMPQSIHLSVLHPTLPGHDMVLDLLHAGAGRYHGNLPMPTAGHWYVQLGADDWRLSGTLLIPQPAVLKLVPQQ